jgi:hypothetical protein
LAFVLMKELGKKGVIEKERKVNAFSSHFRSRIGTSLSVSAREVAILVNHDDRRM